MTTPTARPPLRLAVLISGRGSNMLAIARSGAPVAVVISDQPDAGGIPAARGLGIDTRIVPWQGAARRAEFEAALDQAIAESGAELVVLAGFMRILSADFAARYAGRMLNIHPSLLPKYRGLHTHQRVLEAKDAEHGASVHFVTAELDGGPLLLQSRVPVKADDTEATLSARVQATEHIIYPRVIGWIADGRLRWHKGQAWLDNRPLDRPVVEDFGEAAKS